MSHKCPESDPKRGPLFSSHDLKRQTASIRIFRSWAFQRPFLQTVSETPAGYELLTEDAHSTVWLFAIRMAHEPRFRGQLVL